MHWVRLLTVISLLFLSGCASGSPGGNAIILYVQTGDGLRGRQRQDDIAITREGIRDLIQRYNQLHPGIVISDYYISGGDLSREVSYRQAHGLGPDLILSTTRQHIELQRLGLTESYPLESNVHVEILPNALEGFQSEQGFSGIPVFIFPEVACYNRSLLNAPTPETINDLIALAASGVPVGFSLRFRDLFWTASGTGAEQALLLSSRRQKARSDRRNPQQTERVIAWLRWLQMINLQRNITFVGDTTALDHLFQTGGLAWIPCRMVSFRSHYDHFGDKLGISPLPGRSAAPATSIAQMLVMTLGKGSSAAQKETAINFTRFIVSRFVQREMMLNNAGILPVNKQVIVPVESSERLAAMYQSFRQAVLLSPEIPGPTQEIDNFVDDTLQSIVLGGEPAVDALDRFYSYLAGER